MTERTYESAAARIEEIIRRLDSGEAELRETLALVKEGRELVDFCAGELEAVGQGLEELRLDELVARLERGGPAPGAEGGGDGGVGGGADPAPELSDEVPPGGHGPP
ncbi:MAG: exodeoxyribonuclease small subunit [Solirubrobacteraceae bacterium]|nr:exodeoxyribonuclease small subunit [Solirubrobacteraceae bacterium]